MGRSGRLQEHKNSGRKAAKSAVATEGSESRRESSQLLGSPAAAMIQVREEVGPAGSGEERLDFLLLENHPIGAAANYRDQMSSMLAVRVMEVSVRERELRRPEGASWSEATEFGPSELDDDNDEVQRRHPLVLPPTLLTDGFMLTGSDLEGAAAVRGWRDGRSDPNQLQQSPLSLSPPAAWPPCWTGGEGDIADDASCSSPADHHLLPRLSYVLGGRFTLASPLLFFNSRPNLTPLPSSLARFDDGALDNPLPSSLHLDKGGAHAEQHASDLRHRSP